MCLDLLTFSGLREYHTRFPKATLTIVYFEFSPKYLVDNERTFNLSAKWTHNGRPFARQDLPVFKPRDFALNTKSYGHGSREPGKWETGKYVVEIEVEGRRVAAGSFVVY